MLTTTQTTRADQALQGVLSAKSEKDLPGKNSFSEVFSSMRLGPVAEAAAESPVIEELPVLVDSSVVGLAIPAESSVIESPLLEGSSAIESPLLEGFSVVGSPLLEGSSVVGLPTSVESSVVGVPTSAESSIIESPLLAESSVIESPVLAESAVIESPVLAESSVIGSPVLAERDLAETMSFPKLNEAKEAILSVMQQLVPRDIVSKSTGAIVDSSLAVDLSLDGSIEVVDENLVIPSAIDPMVELSDMPNPLITPVAHSLDVKEVSNILGSDGAISNQSEQASEVVDTMLKQNSVVSQYATHVASQAGGQINSSVSNAASNSVTSWGGQHNVATGNATAGDALPASPGASQQGQPFSQGGQGGQNPQGQASQQQAMMFAQVVKEHKLQAIEQQAAVKSVDESILKLEAKDLLGGAEIASSDRRGQLPLGLQAISQPVKHPQWGQALGQRVVFMANNSMQQAQITLNPEKLGHIQVSLKLDKDQRMHVSLTAQNGMTRESMESALPKLREMLEQAGITLGSMDVSDQKQFSENNSKQVASENAASNDQVEEEVIIDAPFSTVKTTDNIVDYYA